MRKLLRWIRGAFGIGITWALLWAVIGILLSIVIRIVRPASIGPGEGMGPIMAILGLVGFLSGIGFAAFLSVAERRRSLHELSLARVALWGLLGSAAIPLLLGTDGTMGWLTGLLGATFATSSVAIARRGSKGPRELTEGDAHDPAPRELPS